MVYCQYIHSDILECGIWATTEDCVICVKTTIKRKRRLQNCFISHNRSIIDMSQDKETYQRSF